MTDTDDDSDERDVPAPGDDTEAEDSPAPFRTWEAMVDAIRTHLQKQIAVWPEKVTATIDLVEGTTSSDVPSEGDILVYVHGYLGEGRLDGMNVSGANQAAALRQALVEEFDSHGQSPPSVVAATWNSSTIWPRATERALTAGERLAQWVRTAAGDYERVTIIAHSLGGRVALAALDHLDGVTVDSVGLLGAAVRPETVYSDFRSGIESAVDEGVFNYHSRNDALVCRLYRFRERAPGIGCNGALAEGETAQDSLPETYVDVDVSETVHRHMDYLKPVSETAVGNAVGELVERQLDVDSTGR